MTMLEVGDFEKQSKEEWLQKVASDLKTKSLSEVKYVLDDNITVNPFLSNEDFDELPLPLDYTYSLAGVCIEGFDDEEKNRKALEILTFGPDVLVFYIDRSTNFELLFSSIYLEAITIILIDKDSDPLIKNKLDDFLSKQDHDAVPKVNYTPYNELLYLKADTTFTERIKYFTDTIKNTKKPITAFVELKQDILGQIAEMRALRSLWETHNSNQLCLIGILDESVEVRLDTHPLIAYNYQTISAVMGGCDICLAKDYGNDFEMTRRSLNIQHILKKESYLDDVIDPTSGAYIIEALTKKMLSL